MTDLLFFCPGVQVDPRSAGQCQALRQQISESPLLYSVSSKISVMSLLSVTYILPHSPGFLLVFILHCKTDVPYWAQ